jgi:hypothetical protein
MKTASEAESIQHRLLLQAWESAFADTPVTYLGGPITTGPRFLRWYERQGQALVEDRTKFQALLRSEVIKPNEADLLRAARELRRERTEPVIEPASIHVAEWSQEDYFTLWERFIERHATRIILLPGWQYSAGCAAEFQHACHRGIPVESRDGLPISLGSGLELLRDATEEINRIGAPVAGIINVIDNLERLCKNRMVPAVKVEERSLRKDESLDRLADWINVAQFVSFSPGDQVDQEYARIVGYSPNYDFGDLRTALEALLQASANHSINVRSFTPENPLSREFIYGLTSLDDAVAAVERLAMAGLNTIVNETIDVTDGGVSGVVMGDVLEFAPDDTPRCVEKPGVASLPRNWGISLLSTVYRLTPDLDVPRASRLEFSIHPQPRGWRRTHTLGWEYAAVDLPSFEPKPTWPNRFSRMVGDKVFGLLVAHHIGLPVPRTTIINRRVAPFAFGRETTSREVWIRTSPFEQVPGKYTTVRGWIDPFKLVQEEDPSGEVLRSVIAQAAVTSGYSGGAIVTSDGKLVIEGKKGQGDLLMRGSAPREPLPEHVTLAVNEIFDAARRALGPVGFEWVYDGAQAWVVQLHHGATVSTEGTIVPGEAARWISVDVSEGLERIRDILRTMEADVGLELSGDVGLTSHIAEVIRRAGIPTRITAP